MCSVRSGAGRRQGGTGVRTERLRVQVRCVLRPRLVGGMVKFIKRVRTEGTERGVWAGAVHVRVRVVGGVVGGADEQVE